MKMILQMDSSGIENWDFDWDKNGIQIISDLKNDLTKDKDP
jgi:hypothetical protein